MRPILLTIPARFPAGAAMADGAANQALIYSIPVKAVKCFKPTISLAVIYTDFGTNTS